MLKNHRHTTAMVMLAYIAMALPAPVLAQKKVTVEASAGGARLQHHQGRPSLSVADGRRRHLRVRADRRIASGGALISGTPSCRGHRPVPSLLHKSKRRGAQERGHQGRFPETGAYSANPLKIRRGECVSLQMACAARDPVVGTATRLWRVPVMKTRQDHDVAVIGAGVFGAWIAYHLQRSGKTVVLLDAYGAANSRASSGGESRIIRMGYGADEILYTLVYALTHPLAGILPPS